MTRKLINEEMKFFRKSLLIPLLANWLAAVLVLSLSVVSVKNNANLAYNLLVLTFVGAACFYFEAKYLKNDGRHLWFWRIF
ncbi:MAG: hypothetical protein RRY34_08275, partial [Victivallaceae bacterium]